MTAAGTQVLIIDDEPDLRELLCDALAGEGLAVSAAGSGAEARQLAQRGPVDFVIADIRLPDGNGLDVLDQLRRQAPDVPAVIISGAGDAHIASEAARRGCVDFLTKPLDLPRLRQAVREELRRRQADSDRQQRLERYRALARTLNHRRHLARHELSHTCAALSKAYRVLNRQLSRQETAIRFLRQLLACRTDDDIFRGLFGLFSEHGGSLFGVAMVCDQQARLQMVGRFGMPAPDSVGICQQFADCLIESVLDDPQVMRLEADKHLGLFPSHLHGRLTGVTFLTMPLLPAAGELIGLVILYRKGEQPFSDEEAELASMIAPSVALRVQTTESPEAD